MEALRQYDVMAQPFPYEKEVALYDGEYIPPQPILEPDKDFYRSISMEEVRERLHRVVDKLYAKK